MKVVKFIAVNLFVIGLSACGGSGGSSDTGGSTASYELEFTTNWSAGNFSTNFPTNRHFSGLIGLTHNSKVKIFEEGVLASDGIVSVAETGSKNRLRNEIGDLQNQGDSGATIDGSGIPQGSTSVTATFEVSQEHPLVSIVTMLAPSPDWFTGVNSLPLYVDGEWVEEIEVQLISYDAGSDSGLTFSSGNSATIPRDNITKLTTDRSDTDFENGVHFSTSLTIGTFKFKKIN